MTWLALLALISSFAAGWTGGVWQCSRRQDCPRYTAYALKKWKHDMSMEVGRHCHHGDLSAPKGSKP